MKLMWSTLSRNVAFRENILNTMLKIGKLRDMKKILHFSSKAG
jgi:hypothetical protein